MITRTLTVALIGIGLVALVSAQQPTRQGEAAFKPLPASSLGTLRQPVKDIPKPQGKWRTPWGDPDLQGIWNNGTSTPFARAPQFGDREYLTDEELAAAKKQAASRLIPETVEETRAAQAEGGVGTGTGFWFEISDPNGRTSSIYDPPDGRLPPTTAQYQAQQKERARLFREPRLDKSMWERQGAWVRCISRGQPAAMNPVVYNNNYQIVQTPGYVVLLQEMVHVSRIIPLDKRPHVDPKIRMWEGDARGWWEGDTLVVETTNFHPDSEPMDRQPTAAGVDYKLIQKFTRITDTEVDYRYTLDAPSVFTRPWSAAIPMTSRAAPSRMQEYACVEGDNAVRLTVNGLVRTYTDPEYAKRWRAEIAAEEAGGRGGRRGGGPAGAPPAGAAPAGRGAGGQ